MRRFVAFTVSLLALFAHPGGVRAQGEIDFEKEVQPILEARCYRCHGAKRQRGELRLDLRAALFEDRDPSLLVPGEPAASEFYVRLVLPEEDPKRMPKGRDPLPAEEIAVIRDWIAEGAKWPPADPRADDSAAVVITLPPLTAEEAQSEEQALAAIRERGGHSERIAAGARAIGVSLAPRGSRCVDADLELLAPLSRSLVWLDLSGTGISDPGARVLGELRQLRRLNLARTSVSAEGLRSLANLEHLESLNLHGTAVDDSGVAILSGLPALRMLHLWSAPVTPEAVARLRGCCPRLKVDCGEGAAALIRSRPSRKQDARDQ